MLMSHTTMHLHITTWVEHTVLTAMRNKIKVAVEFQLSQFLGISTKLLVACVDSNG